MGRVGLEVKERSAFFVQTNRQSVNVRYVSIKNFKSKILNDLEKNQLRPIYTFIKIYFLWPTGLGEPISTVLSSLNVTHSYVNYS